MRFVCDSCRAQYMISDEKVGAKGVKVRCKKCGFVILVRRMQEVASPPPPSDDGVQATQVMQNPLTSDPYDEPTSVGSPEDAAALRSALENAFGDAESRSDAAGEGTADAAAPREGASMPSSGLFAGVEEDEIGAVFDQVLNSGSHPMGALSDRDGDAPGAGLGLGEDTNDDRLSTRVLDAETVRKLAEEAAGSEAGGAKAVVSKGAASEPEKHDWFVAIDERQVGPLTLEKVKGHWDAGEIGPDSLCWRAGFPDWLPLSEVDELTPVLAPQPKKPVIVGSGEDEDSPTLPPGPVESAFSTRARTVTPAPMQAAAAVAASGTGSGEDAGGWKPSAASALASLVKEEIEALARPPQPEPSAASAATSSGSQDEGIKGLLDLPSEEHRMGDDLGEPEGAAAGAFVSAAASSPAAFSGDSRAGAAAGMPRAGRSDSGRASPQLPQSAASVPAAVAASSGGLSKPLLIGGAVMLGLVVVLVVAVLALAFGDGGSSAPVVQAPPQPAPVQVAQAPAPVTPEPPAAATAAAPSPEAAPAATEPAKAEPEDGAKPEAVAAAPKDEEARKAEPAPAPEPKRSEPVARRTERAQAQPAPRPAPAPAPAPREERAARTTSPAEAADDFDAVFGGSSGGSSRKGASGSTKTAAAQAKGSDSVYIPPAPGSSTGPVSLGQSDIMAVVLQNKAAIQRCVNEQKEKDPSVSGTLVMQWSIRTNGRTERINAQSAEFRSTHVATCMGGLIRGWRFPAHQEQGEPINFPFKF